MQTEPYKPWLPKKEPWLPPDYDDRVIYAVRAMDEGRATPAQQKIAMHWIRYVTSIDQMSFRPGKEGERDTAFAEGKRFVGLQLTKMLNPRSTPPDPVAKPTSDAANRPSPGVTKKKRGPRNARR